MPESVTSIQEIVIHEHLAVSRTIERWRTKAAQQAILRSFGPEIQELENVFWEILLSRFVTHAYGVSLERIGKIVGQAKEGMIEAQFRIWVMARIRINRSNGRPDDVIEVLQIVGEDDFRFLEYYPRSFDVHFDETPDTAADLLAGLVRPTRMGGIAGAVVGSPEPFSATIVGSYDEDLPTDTQGGADEAQTVGGVGAYVYQ